MIEEKLGKFVVNYLTEEQYNAALQAGTLNDNDFYCTSDDGNVTPGGGSLVGSGAPVVYSTDSKESQVEKLMACFETIENNSARLSGFCMYIADIPAFSEGDFSYITIWYPYEGFYDESTGEYCLQLTAVSNTGWYSGLEATAMLFINEDSKDVRIVLTSKKIVDIEALNNRIAALEAMIASGEFNIAVDPTNTTNKNLWIATS